MDKILKISAVALMGLGLAACDNDVERAAGGAAAGYAVSELTGVDRETAIILGAGAGAVCDDVGACR